MKGVFDILDNVPFETEHMHLLEKIKIDAIKLSLFRFVLRVKVFNVALKLTAHTSSVIEL